MLATLDGLIAGGQFDGRAPVIDAVQYVLTDLKGWWGSAPATRVKHTDRVASPGAQRAAAYLGTSSYELKVTATSIAQDAAVMRRVERRIAALCSDPGEVYPLTVEDQAGSLLAYVERDGEIVGEFRDGLTWSTIFSIPLVAADPYRYDPAWVSPRALGVAGAGSGGIAFASPGMSTASPGIAMGTAAPPTRVVVQGTGTADSLMVFQIEGATSGVQVNDLDGTSVVGVRGEIRAGESVFVNCTPRVAYDVPGCLLPIPPYGAVLGTSSARGAVWVTGGWPRLAPGEARQFQLYGAAGVGAALTVHTRGAWI